MAESQVLKCSFCDASQHEVRKLVPGPAVLICNVCVGRALDALVGDAPTRVDRLNASQDTRATPVYCMFCGKDSKEVTRLLGREGRCICNECLMTSLNILIEGEAPYSGYVRF